MHLLSLLLCLTFAILPSFSQDTWPLPTLDITQLASEGLITLTPYPTTNPTPVLATPTGVADPHAASSCTAVAWKLHDISAFDADPNGETIDYSHVTFYFNDLNSNVESYCEHNFPAGSGESPVDTEHWCPCYNYGMSYLYAGSIMGLRRQFDCGGQTITAQGQAPLGLECRGTLNGTLCQNVADIHVPVTTVVD